MSAVEVFEPSPASSLSLDQLPDAVAARVVEVEASEPGIAQSVLRRLAEIGFIPGERVLIVGRGAPGGTPLAVRIGTSTFALRLHEARCIQVSPLTSASR